MNELAFSGKLYDRLKPENIDDNFLESYRKLLFSQYATMSNPLSNVEAKAEAERIYKMKPEEIEWDDLYQLELTIVKLEPIESLRRRVWILRNEYKEIASADELKDYVASNPPDAKNGEEKELRADAVRLQEELNWRYVVIWVFESFRGNIIQMLTAAIVIFAVLVLGLLLSWNKLYSLFSSIDINFPLIGIIILPGILGGLTSTLRRAQQARLSRNADIDLSELQEAKLGIYLSPLLGGVFSLLLFLLFAGGFLTGGLFPKLSFDSLVPSEGAILDYTEMAKLMVWSFIAGFAEKFVPDRLERFTQDNSGRSDSKK